LSFFPTVVKNQRMPRLKDTAAKVRFRVLGCLLTAIAGVLLLLLPENALDDLSYDLPLRWRSNLAASTNAVIVYFNQSSLNDIFQTNGILKPSDYTPPLRTNMPPDRRIYVTLLDVMKKAAADLVFFDCDFSDPHPNEDEPFALAIRKNGRVILGGVPDNTFVQQTGNEGGITETPILPPNSTLTNAVTNWGMLEVMQSLSDGVIRQILTRDDQKKSAIFLAAQFSGFTGNPNTPRWINYYGPPNTIDSVLLSKALTAQDDSRFFHRVVFVGGLGNSPGQPDIHPTPYGAESSGVEILATSYLNLVRSDWLERWSLPLQAMLVAVWGMLAAAFFLCFRPRHILWMAPAVIAIPLIAGFYTQWEMHRWWSWAICAFVQAPLAAAWAMIANRWAPWPPLAFISYRRVEGEGSGYAQAFWSDLEQHGCGAICDVKAELTTTPFRPQLLALIDSVPNFILVLSRDSLNSGRINNEADVLRAEIRHALQHGKKIIPVMIGDFKMPPPEQLPADIRALPDHHAFRRTDDNPWAAMGNIMANLRRPIFVGRWWRTGR
jgi:CHASE2 domain-containing sensor protein